MHRVTIMKLTVADENAERFQEACREQTGRVKENEPGTVLCTFIRRNNQASTILPMPPNGHTDYIHLQAYTSQEADDHHRELEREWWGPTFRSLLAAPFTGERYMTPEITTGITRDFDWGPHQRSFVFHRFQIKEGQDEEFEEQASHQLGVVTKGEPGTKLYTFCKRPAEGSAFLPSSNPERTEYLHMSIYEDEDAWQQHRRLEHRDDGKWCWGPTYRQYIAVPLVNEQFRSEQIVCGLSRDAQWGTVYGDVDIAPFG